MKSGKKSLATRIVYESLENLAQKTKKPVLEALDIALQNASPSMELKSRRVGGANYQIPIEVKPDRRTTLAVRWIVEAAKSQKGKAMDKKLSEELINAFNNTGGAVKKKTDTHRMAEANKAFAHFAW